MAKKKTITDSTILNLYMDYVVEFKSTPLTVEEFSKHFKFDSDIFYNYYSSFTELQRSIFKTIFDNSIEVLKNSVEFETFDNRNKLISLYFTIFENLSLNRDYVVFTLDGFENQLKALNIFSDFKNSFLAFIDEIGLDNSFINIDGLENIQKKTIKQSAWLQFLFIMKFWLNDTSDSFEKTDVLIEKSINTSFDLLDHSFLKSAIDLGKFLYKEQIQSH